MWLISKFIKSPPEDRAVIEDKSKPVGLQSFSALKNAKQYSGDLSGAIKCLKSLDYLLSCPMVEHNSEKHLRMTLGQIDLQIDGKNICIVFDKESGEPIFAYLRDPE